MNKGGQNDAKTEIEKQSNEKTLQDIQEDEEDEKFFESMLLQFQKKENSLKRTASMNSGVQKVKR